MSRARLTIAGALLVGALLSTAGCAKLRVGRSFDAGKAGEIQPLLTERSAVRQLLGAPARAKTVGDVTVEVHRYVTPDQFTCVLVSYRGDTVVKVTRVQ
jgi:hypothetical protein